MNSLLTFLIAEGASWVRSERERLAACSRPLTPAESQALASHFPPDLLASMRVAVEDEIQNPTFYSTLVAANIPPPLDFRQMAGITFADTVLVAKTRMPLDDPGYLPLLFHEAVHVLQYAVLGIDRFMSLYVMGWANAGNDYARIPLEEQAYQLQARYESGELSIPTVEEVLRAFPAEAHGA